MELQKRDLSRKKHMMVDFSGQDLRGVAMDHAEFVCCKFTKTDLTDVDASNSIFAGGSMKDTKCTRTNFMNSRLMLYFAPSDCLGMTLTLSCHTFKGMTVSNLWWMGWLYFAHMMKPVDSPERLRADLVSLIGEARFTKLDHLFRTREL